MIFFSSDPKKNKTKKIKVFCLILFLVFSFSFSFFIPNPVQAQVTTNEAVSIPAAIRMIFDKLVAKTKDGLSNAWTATVKSVIRNALSRLAYDTATWIGSGNVGQKPLYETKELGDLLQDAKDDAAGAFIASLSETFGTDLCRPDLALKLKIGLGLTEQVRPGKPDCTWQELQKNWSSAIKKEDFLKTFASTFEPTNSDLGISLTVSSRMFEEMIDAKIEKGEKTVMNEGWLDVRDIGGRAKTPPKQTKEDLAITKKSTADNVSKTTDNPVVDAANVFLNQLAVTAFQTAMKKLTSFGEGSGPRQSLLSANSDPSSGGGAAGVRKEVGKILQPSFGSRGDYNILGELVSCNSGVGSVGPTNCVINDVFSQAIQEKKTVGQTFKGSPMPFGFKKSGDTAIEPSYLEGIPYRSMIILRKFRIIPIGWEIAAEYIKNNPQAVKDAYLGKMIECFDANDSYTGFYDDWCKGLVDPDWVFKAPQNYCAKEGFGEQIIFQQSVSQGKDDKGNDLPPKLLVNRLDTYCADEQSCIKEKDDGSCEYFGYCTEERRKWNFAGESCEPIYNSCETFKSEDGQTISYLKNTLGFCDEENFGCEKYAKGSVASYATTTKKNDWTKNEGFDFFNKNVQDCEAGNEGCHEFLRFRSGVGTNLIRNSGFEQNSPADSSAGGFIGSMAEPSAVNPNAEPEKFWPIWGSSASIVDNAPERGGKVLYINSASSPAGFYSLDRSASGNASVLPQGFVMEPETSYTLSADIYIVNADSVILMIGRDGQYLEKKEVSFKNSWIRESVTIKNNKDILANEIRIFGNGAGNIQFYIDNIKFEVGNKATNYNEYRQNNLVYQKMIPRYLEDICYVNWQTGNYSLKANAPIICKQYARQCSRDEANCEMYTAVNGNSRIPAAVTDKDYCLAECNGFDAYVQTNNNFNSRQAFYFIPKTAKKCSSAEVGCEEFTNLDKSAEGGEGREYYSYLRQCVKPNSAGNTCATFYTWEGNNEQGEQLSSHSLKSGASGDVSLTSDDSAECSEAIFNLSPGDPQYNPDCRKIYNQAGAISYHLYSRTISCTEDCHPYRLSNKNILTSALIAADCTGADKNWNASAGVCYSCENGGEWSVEHNSCIYKATPAESLACAAASNGCAEFNGNQGNNVKQIFLSTFEGGADNWTNGVVSNISFSGKSAYQFNNNISRQIGFSVKKGGAYSLSFVAKSAGASPVSLWVGVSSNGVNEFFTADAGAAWQIQIRPNEWGIYTLNLPYLGLDINSTSTMGISVNSSVLIDNIKLSAINERFYLIRNSWNTPASCNQDENGKPYPLYMLGCAEYKDRLGNTHYLHRFNRLCQESAVGCEAIIDTQNSTKQASEYFATGNGTQVSSDRVIYAVYDPDKKCSANNKGCERYGLAKSYENSALYTDVFKKNDPDKYNTILCTAEGVGCDKFAAESGDYYFKDPGDMVCEWRQKAASKDSGWFKKKIKRCGGVGAICATNAECGATENCKLDDRDLPCPSTKFKTFGQGGSGNEVYQPTQDAGFAWAGLCSAEQSGCTEYIDPISDFSSNLVYNPDFKQNVGGGRFGDGWSGTSLDSGDGWQNVSLDGNTLYVLTVEGNNTATVSTTLPILYLFGQGANALSQNAYAIVGAAASSSIAFYADTNVKAQLFVENRRVGSNSKITLKKVIIDYQLIKNIDKTTCYGVPNLSEGCVLFNERATVGISGIATTTKNAWEGYGIAINKSPKVNNANELIKVNPDRVCNKWLACKTYVIGEDKKPVCFDIAECNRLDTGGNCVNFVTLKENERNNRVYGVNETSESIKNVSGYAKVGYDSTAFANLPNDLFNFGVMKQYGQEVKVSNGNFELYSASSQPAGWSPALATWTSTSSGKMFDVIMDPVSAQKIGINYPVEGTAFLRYSVATSTFSPLSDTIRITAGEEYYISYKINTLALAGGPANFDIIARGTNTVLASFPTFASQDWHTEIHKITFLNTSLINIRLGAKDDSGGYVYIDDIKISPALKVQASSTDETYVNQSCRLYPREDSLSCDYYDDTGMRLKGDVGYCLEYDRAPGNPNTCLLWWPIDKAQGQGAGGSAKAAQSYNGPAPLFYCIGAPTETDSRPYIAADETYYMVDETLQIVVNSTNVTTRFGYKGDNQTCITNIVCANNATGINDPGLTQICKDFLQATNIERDKDIDTFGPEDLFNPGPKPLKIDLNTANAAEIKTIFDYGGCDIPVAGNISCCSEYEPILVGRSAQYGTIDPYLENLGDNGYENKRIYLNYGKNDITVNLISRHGGGVNFALFGGYFYYYDQNNVKHKKSFNITDEGTLSGVEVPVINNSNIASATVDISAPNKHSCALMGASLHDDMDSWDLLPFFDVKDLKNGSNKRSFIVDDEDMPDDYCNSGGAAIIPTYITITIPPVYPCTKIANVVDRQGTNKVWTERFKESGGYSLPCNSSPFAQFAKNYWQVLNNSFGSRFIVETACRYASDYLPFGSMVTPAGDAFFQSNPANWMGDGAMIYEAPDKTNSNPTPYQTRFGQLYNKNDLSYLFAESYGIWDWNNIAQRYVINNDAGENWVSPLELCPDNIRPKTNDNCSIRPDIFNIKLSNALNHYIFGRGFVNLTFNSKVDTQQAPLVFYEVDWGDNEKLTVSGMDMNAMSATSTPHSAFHSYDYWDLFGKYEAAKNENPELTFSNMTTLYCASGNFSGIVKEYCSIKPKIKVKDNWGWCSEGRNLVPCPTPSSAVCVNGNGVEGVIRSYCRNYQTSQLGQNSKYCPSTHQYCSDGYYESPGEIIVFKD